MYILFPLKVAVLMTGQTGLGVAAQEENSDNQGAEE